MKKIFIAILSVAVLFSGCNAIDSLLDTTDYGAYNTGNFPKTEKDADQVVAGLYYTMAHLYSDSPINTIYMKNIVASDDMIGSGSTTSTDFQGADRFLEEEQDAAKDVWTTLYNGIYRANFCLESIPNIEDEKFSNAKSKNYLIGQAYFFRAWFNWMLTEYYETMPLVTTTNTSEDPAVSVRASVDDIYALITSDLLEAIKLMPAEYGYSRDLGRSGRATKYAAESVLARVWMFYTGFYKKTDMCGVSKSDIINYLKDVRDNSNFGLVDDPREIWPSTNEYSSGFAYGTDFNTFASKNNLHWVGDRCKETIWACSYSNVYTSSSYNRLPEYFGLRNSASAPDAKCYPYGTGYAKGTVNPIFVEQWHEDPDYGPQDKRLWGSVLAVTNVADYHDWLSKDEVELPNHPGYASKEFERTFFHPKKYIVMAAYDGADKKVIYKNFYYAMNMSNSNNNKSGNKDDVVYVRYADVLLMLDELQGTVDGMNQLRTRAGLQPYDSYTFERLQKERRYELCFEGLRFTDLRRWYPETAGDIIAQNQIGAVIAYKNKLIKGGWADIPSRPLAQRYKLTRGFWMVPQSEILLSNGGMEQTVGFRETDDWMLGNAQLPYEGVY